jgi:hypothetical protein
MQLRSQPARPRFVALALIAQTDHNDIWRKYMY